jgi:hypothetical protein
MKKLHEKTTLIESKIDKEIKDFPNPKTHKQISFLKSAVRILGYIVLPLNLENAVVLLIVSEVIGIIEELV